MHACVISYMVPHKIVPILTKWLSTKRCFGRLEGMMDLRMRRKKVAESASAKFNFASQVSKGFEGCLLKESVQLQPFDLRPSNFQSAACPDLSRFVALRAVLCMIFSICWKLSRQNFCKNFSSFEMDLDSTGMILTFLLCISCCCLPCHQWHQQRSFRPCQQKLACVESKIQYMLTQQAWEIPSHDIEICWG